MYDVGEGVCHQLMMEKGNVFPGDIVIGSDSHTCTYGAIGSFATGVGSTDLAAGMLTGQLWFKVPETMLIKLNGAIPAGIYAKDLMLFVISNTTADGATYKAVEFQGSAIDALSIEGRMTMSNMAIEMGAKVGLMPVDLKTKAWVAERGIGGDAWLERISVPTLMPAMIRYMIGISPLFLPTWLCHTRLIKGCRLGKWPGLRSSKAW